MYSIKKRNNLTKTREKLNLPELCWKFESQDTNYLDLDYVIAKIISNFRYNWYFKNVMFYDSEYNLSYFFDRILLTRRSLIFFYHKNIKSNVQGNINDQYWKVNVGSTDPKIIINPVVHQQFMINRLSEILKVKLFLKISIINVVMISKTKSLEIYSDVKNQKNIKLFNMEQEPGWREVVDKLLKEDAIKDNIYLDETILSLFQALSSHAGHNKRSDKEEALFGLYHRF